MCHDEYIEVTVERDNYPGLDTNVTHLEDEACVPGYRDQDKVVFRFGLEDCKTQHEEDKEAIYYKNRIIAVVKDEDEDEDITRSNTRVLPFQCSYKKKAFVSKVKINPRSILVTTDKGKYLSTTIITTTPPYKLTPSAPPQPPQSLSLPPQQINTIITTTIIITTPPPPHRLTPSTLTTTKTSLMTSTN